MSFGVYVHIPYCIQRCSYCDFATFVQNEVMPPEEYVNLVLKEMERRPFHQAYPLDTLYFGGGTPSLIPAQLIVSLIQGLEKIGFGLGPGAEVTLEINPATVDERKLEIYLENGVNRFSVGAQTFDDQLLKRVKREHSAAQTLQTLDLLRKYKVNFSFDILFALPTQTREGLVRDLDIAIEMEAKHISPYCLTVPTGHPLSKARPTDEEQVDMFNLISERLGSCGFEQYEISNFSLPNYQSRHNLLYWSDQEYWGLGLSAHSYSKEGPWGSRFWNPSSMASYEADVAKTKSLGENRKGLFEVLESHQSLTDLCHTFLRRMKGLPMSLIERKFGTSIASLVSERMGQLKDRKLLEFDNEHWRLSNEGILMSNLVFEELTFLSLPSY